MPTSVKVDDVASGSESLSSTGITIESPAVTVAVSSSAIGATFAAAAGAAASDAPALGCSSANPGAARVATVVLLINSATAVVSRVLGTGTPIGLLT